MTSTGKIRSYEPEEGWGVIDSPENPGGCWLHFSAWLVDGARVPVTGEPVIFVHEAARQDGYDFRALEAWPAGTDPVHHDVDNTSSAYGSSFTVTLLGEDLS